MLGLVPGFTSNLPMPYLLGLDVSTTATKALLIDTDGSVVAVASAPHTLESPRPLWSEQDPAQWWQATQQSIRTVLHAHGVGATEVVGIGLTGQMHGLTLLDTRGEVLRPAILWNDQRAAAECDTIRARLGLDRLVAHTGNDAFPGFTAPKLLWVRQHEPAVYARIARVLLPKDYVRYRLTGAFATDVSDAGGMLLLDLARRAWSHEVLAALDLPLAWLPQVFEGTAVTGTLTPDAAAATGLHAGTPVVAGGGDQAAQAVGVGAVRPGVVALTLGTSGVVFASCDTPLVEASGRVHAFPHAVPGRWHLMGVMLSAAGSLRWYHDTFAAPTDYDALLAEAVAVPMGCEGLTFLPYLSGERTPHADPHVRGAFVGLTLHHTRAHLTRAVLEGITFGLRDNLALLAAMGLPAPDEVRLSGGGTRNPHWRQLIANILAHPLVTVQTTEGAAFGAALLAGVGTGVWPDVEAACAAGVGTTGTTLPHPEASADADAAYARFRTLYPLLKPHYDTLAQ
jgi:xylulokinase